MCRRIWSESKRAGVFAYAVGRSGWGRRFGLPRIVVHKYGGTSLATPEAVNRVARRVIETCAAGLQVVVVVSAMGATTEQLLRLATAVSPSPSPPVLDLLLSTGEHVSMALLCLALRHHGQPAVCLGGGEAGIVTNGAHTNARILEIWPDRVRRELAAGHVVVVAGFQGASREGAVTTLGRGGSDTTAVALAAALGAESCDTFTDVDAVYSADPRIVPAARPLEELSPVEMQELAWHGAQVLKAEAVELARDNGVTLTVAASHGGGAGTRVRAERTGEPFRPAQAAVCGVAGRKDLCRLRCAPGGLDGEEGEALLAAIATFDLVFAALGGSRGSSEILVSTREMADSEATRHFLERRFPEVEVRSGLGAVSVIGFGIGSRPASLLDAWRALETWGFEVQGSFTGRESLSFVLPAADVDEAVRRMHRRLVEAEAAGVGFAALGEGARRNAGGTS